MRSAIATAAASSKRPRIFPKMFSSRIAFFLFHRGAASGIIDGMPRRRLFPLPIEGIMDHPEFVALTSAGRGMLMTLIMHYWQSECRDLPTRDNDLFAIARADRAVWRKHKPVVLRIFEHVKPELDTYLAERVRRKAMVRELGIRGASVTKLRAIERKRAREIAPEAVPQRAAEQREKHAAPEDRGARLRVAPSVKRG